MIQSKEQDGRRIGKYLVVEKIGEGGFGKVYRAIDPELDRTVAIKTLTSSDESYRLRFQREAKFIARLDHERIVRVYNSGIDGEEPYLVEEMLSGEDLKETIAGGKIALKPKVQILAEVAEGLAHAHGKGIIHRDIKPGNIRVLENGHVKIMDFGIAKQLDSQSQQLTQVGSAVGTVAYLSPEQIDGTEVDRRADIFSFGVVAYELLASARPFRGETISQLLHQITMLPHEPLESMIPGLFPERLTSLIERSLEKRPEDRPETMDEVQRELERVLLELRVQSTTAPIRAVALNRGDTQAETETGPGSAAIDSQETRLLSEKSRPRLAIPGMSRPAMALAMAAVILIAMTILVVVMRTVDAGADADTGGSELALASGSGVAAPTEVAPQEVAAPPVAVTPPEAAPPRDPAQIMLVSDSVQVSEHLLPALKRQFDGVVVDADEIEGRERNPTVGRILVVEASVANRNDSAYGVQLTNCEASVNARLLDAETRAILEMSSAGSVKKNCELAIDAAAEELAGQLTLR